MASRAVSVASTATRLDNQTTYGAPGVGLAIYNNGASTIYIGGADVTTANGFPLAAGQSMAIDAGRGDAIYGRTASGTEEARVLDVSLTEDD